MPRRQKSADDCNPHGIERPLIRCHMDDTGVSTCNEYEVRRVAMTKNEQLGLDNRPLTQWVSNHMMTATNGDKSKR